MSGGESPTSTSEDHALQARKGLVFSPSLEHISVATAGGNGVRAGGSGYSKDDKGHKGEALPLLPR